MKITILCSDLDHPVFPYLKHWAKRHSTDHTLSLCQDRDQLVGGDILFLISCSQIIRKSERDLFRAVLVIHASALPQGRGWSPHIWSVLEGKDHLVVTLLEAEDKVDSGAIWHQVRVPLAGHELWDEINAALFEAELGLMDFALANFETIEPVLQQEGNATYFKKRTPEDSRLDPEKSIAEQFNLLRVADPQRFPAYFDWLGHRYVVKVSKQTEK